MQTEPDTLLPALTVESNRIREGIAGVLAPFVVDRGLARVSTSATPRTSWPGWSCRTSRHRALGPGGPRQVARLVRSELLAGVVVPVGGR